MNRRIGSVIVTVTATCGLLAGSGVALAQEDDQDCGNATVCVGEVVEVGDVDPDVGPVVGPNEFGPFQFEFESIF